MKLFRQSVLIAILVSGLLVAMLPAAHADIDSVSLAGTCSSVTVTVDYTRFYVEGDEFIDILVYLEGGSLVLGWPSTVLPSGSSGQVTFTIPFDEQPEGTQIFVNVNHWDKSENWDGVVVDYTCSNPVASPVASPVPGCDVLQLLPAQAVVGQFNWNSEVYWVPGHMAIPPIIIDAGKTYYVAGQDASETYYKVLISCSWVWVRKDTVGPNFDDVWLGAPLPTTIVN